jgi:hypothetical protein
MNAEITLVTRNFIPKLGDFGALVACPTVGLRGGWLFHGKTVNKTTHQINK